MKHFILTLLVILTGIYVHAQKADREMIIVEGATGFWTQFCAGAALGADQLIDSGYNVAIINNHYQDSLANTYSLARNSYYDVTVYPTYFFDGILSVIGGSSTSSLFPQFEPKVFERNFVPSDFTFEWDITQTGDQYTANITINNQGGNISPDLFLQFVVTESYLPITWGLTEVQNHANRLMVPDEKGTHVDFSSGNSQDYTLEFTPEPFWDTDYCEVIIFVQDTTTKEILQGSKKMLAVPQFNVDAQAKRIKFPVDEYCGESVEPIVFIKNMGEENLTSLDISYKINEENYQNYAWTGNLGFNVGEDVLLPEISFTQQEINNITYYVSNPNGLPDPNTSNDTLSKDFTQAPQFMYAEVWVLIKTDDFPEETSWAITDSEGTIWGISEDMSGMADTVLIDTVILYGTGCYTFEIYDSFGDGLCCDYGEGYYQVLDKDSVVLIEGAEFTYDEFRPLERNGENILVADFEADNPSTVQGAEVQFTDLSFGTISSWHWEFEGGTPATSSEENPMVIYSDTGFYSVKLVISDEINSDSLTKENYIYVDQGVGIRDLQESAVQVYPNPSTGLIYIKGAESIQTDVYNLMGKKIRSVFMNNKNQIDLSDLKRGIYFLKIKLKDNTIISRKISLLN